MYLQAWCGRWRRLPCCSDWGQSGGCKRGLRSDSWWNGANLRWRWIPCRKPWMKSYSLLLPPRGYEWQNHWAVKRAWCKDERKSYWPRPPEICVVLMVWAHQQIKRVMTCQILYLLSKFSLCLVSWSPPFKKNSSTNKREAVRWSYILHVKHVTIHIATSIVAYDHASFHISILFYGVNKL